MEKDVLFVFSSEIVATDDGTGWIQRIFAFFFIGIEILGVQNLAGDSELV